MKISNETPPALTDLGELLQRVQAGDCNAFAVFHRRTKNVALRVVFPICRNAAEAEDVLQEAYLSVWKRVLTFDAKKGHALPWLLQIVRNGAIDATRSRRRDLAAKWFDAVDADEVYEVTVSPQPGPLEQLMDTRRARDVERCLATLRQDHRQVLRMAFIEGMSHSTIAAQVNQPLGTVKAWVRRGLLQMKRGLVEHSASHPHRSFSAPPFVSLSTPPRHELVPLQPAMQIAP